MEGEAISKNAAEEVEGSGKCRITKKKFKGIAKDVSHSPDIFRNHKSSSSFASVLP